MKWSNLFLLTAVASSIAPVALADDPTATVVEAKAITIRLVGDGQGFAAESKDAPGAEAKKVPFIGVVTSPLGEAVRAQTTLPEDVGLSVDVVSPDSPAAKAGLKAHDILAKYDDQLLCAAVQLSALVKRTGTGNKATLIVLRGGKELPIEVTVGEHAAQATFKVEGLNIAVGQPGQPGGPRDVAGQPLAPEVIRLIEEMGVKAGGVVFGEQYGFAVPAPGVDAPVLPQSSGPNDTPQVQRNQRIVLVNPNVQSQSQSVSIVANDDGRVELREVNGKRTVTILDKAGAQQYSGPLDTQEDREKIPAELRSRVEQAEASAGPKAVIPPLAPPVPVAPGSDAAGGGSR